MFYGVLRMPYEMAMDGEISRWQFWQRAQEAVERVAKAEARVAELSAAIDKLAACKGRYHTEANFKELLAVREGK
jgi:hypothetical protein